MRKVDFPDNSMKNLPFSLTYFIVSVINYKKIIGTEQLAVTTRDGLKRSLLGV